MSVVIRGWIVAGAVALAVSGCMTGRKPAPVVQRSPEPVQAAEAAKPAATKPGDPRPNTYTVKRGETLYGIALDHGQDYRDLVRWNNLANANVIEVGQVLYVRDPATVASAPAGPPAAESIEPGAAIVTPYHAPPMVEGREMGRQTPSTAKEKPGTPVEAARDPSVIASPKAVKVPYSDAALARLRAAQQPEPTAPATSAAPAAPAPRAETAPAASDEPDAVAWSWPTSGKVVANFNDNGGPKGVQIAGEMGQPVLASAGGRVVYTGSGLRGYGNLVIIKHNNTYLSAYAHNRSVLVKQGDNVSKGQKIAEMGNSDASRVMLHFEIRRLGKPVDPMKFLPPA